MTTHKKKKVYKYNSRAAAQARANEARAQGHQAHVRYDDRTGKWIVEIFFLVLALGLIGGLLRNNQ